ncbi:hypothetical protein ACVDFE_21070 [Lentzea chajnantorensis]
MPVLAATGEVLGPTGERGVADVDTAVDDADHRTGAVDVVRGQPLVVGTVRPPGEVELPGHDEPGDLVLLLGVAERLHRQHHRQRQQPVQPFGADTGADPHALLVEHVVARTGHQLHDGADRGDHLCAFPRGGGEHHDRVLAVLGEQRRCGLERAGQLGHRPDRRVALAGAHRLGQRGEVAAPSPHEVAVLRLVAQQHDTAVADLGQPPRVRWCDELDVGGDVGLVLRRGAAQRLPDRPARGRDGGAVRPGRQPETTRADVVAVPRPVGRGGHLDHRGTVAVGVHEPFAGLWCVCGHQIGVRHRALPPP